MRILHILSPARAGGLERVVHALAIGQQRRGHELLVLPVTDDWPPDHPFAAPLIREGVKIVPLVLPNRAYLRERAALAQLFREHRPDVVHSHGYHTDVLCGDVARRLGIATVSTAHGFTRGPWRNRAYEYLDRIALRYFDAVAAVSQPLADELVRAGVSRDRVRVVPNGWSTIAAPLDRASARRELGVPVDAFVVAWVGRMTGEKGLDVFIDALAGLGDVPLHACIVGDGPERAVESARAATMGLQERIRWTGPVREAGRYFAAFDTLVISSRTEGVPMVLLEAMAARVPLVVTAVGGIPAVVSPGEAMLVRPDQPAELAAGIRAVRGDRGAAAARATAARARLDAEFAEEPWLKRYDEVYGAARTRRHRP